MKEIWQPIDEFPTYLISNYGRVISTKNKRQLTPYSNKLRREYAYISIQENKRRKNMLVHRLVAKAFIPNPLNKPCVNHLDCDTTNNEVTNLEWVTHKENVLYMMKLGRSNFAYGEKSGNNKLKEATVKKIISEILEKKLSYNKIAKKYNTNYSNIAHIARGSRWGYLKLKLE